MSAAETLVTPSDEERRAKLRHFLMRCRARLTPEEVGLPSTSRRRVAGLRREEIAELVEVSSDWYRWFESGRPIRVSVEFVSRVADALRLARDERAMLFALALPEVAAVIEPSIQPSSTALIESMSGLRKVIRRMWSASSVDEILMVVTEAAAENLKDGEQFGVFERVTPGEWNYPVAFDHRKVPNRVADMHFLLREGLTAEQIDESMLHPALRSPGDVGTTRELIRTPSVKRRMYSALERAGFKDANCLAAHINSADGVAATVFVAYLSQAKAFSELERTLFGTLADLGSLATRSSKVASPVVR